MAVGKKPPPGGFGKCSNQAPFDEGLTDAHFRVYGAILCHGGSSGKSTASRETLAGNLGMSVSTIKRAVRVLIERGYVVEAAKSGPYRSRTLEVLIPPRNPSDGEGDQDGQAAETSKGSPVRPKKGSPVRHKGGHQSTSKGVTSAPQRITLERRTVEEEPREEEPDRSPAMHETDSESITRVVGITLRDGTATDWKPLIELKTRLANVPTRKAAGPWVAETARLVAEYFADEHSHKRYMQSLWQVVRKVRPAEDILKAFKETDHAMMDGKVRGNPGQFFFGCLTTGYDGDRAFAEEIEDRQERGRE